MTRSIPALGSLLVGCEKPTPTPRTTAGGDAAGALPADLTLAIALGCAWAVTSRYVDVLRLV